MDCLACGTTSSPASREHVFSRWLLTEFGPDISMALYKRLDDGAREQRRAEIKLDSFKLKKICKCCNNGWMSKLEESAKPLILGVIRGVREFGSLSEDERRILARWAGKTAIVESHSVGAECPVSDEYLKRMSHKCGRHSWPFRRGGLPHGDAGIRSHPDRRHPRSDRRCQSFRQHHHDRSAEAGFGMCVPNAGNTL